MASILLVLPEFLLLWVRVLPVVVGEMGGRSLEVVLFVQWLAYQLGALSHLGGSRMGLRSLDHCPKLLLYVGWTCCRFTQDSLDC